MTNETIKALERENSNKGALNSVRNSGFVPGVIYGHHRDTVSVKVDGIKMEKFLKHHGVGTSVNFELEGKETLVLIKDIQRDVMKNSLLHVDFQELTAGEKVKVVLPIHFINRDEVITHSTVLQEIMHELEIQTLPKDLVEMIDVDVSKMEIGDTLRVMDLDISKDEKFEVLSDLDNIVVSLSHAKVNTEEEEEDKVETVAAANVPLVSDSE